MRQVHPIQLHILRRLLFAQELRYSAIRPSEMENSQFVFHLSKLIELGYVVKEHDLYKLSLSGKEYANRMDDTEVALRVQPKTTTVFCPIRYREETEYLLHTRNKNPFFGCQGFAAHKVWFGEKLSDAVANGLFEETGLRSNGELFAIRHYHVYSGKDNLVEDKIMYVYRFVEPTGELRSTEEGSFVWIAESSIPDFISNPLEEFWEIFELLTTFSGQISFKEVDQFTEKF